MRYADMSRPLERMMLDKSTQAGQHSYAERGADVYETPACAVEALLRVESIPRVVWEPACGPGSIVKVLRARGHKVIVSDVVDYGCEGHLTLDFLAISKRGDTPAVVTNPPYRLAAEFVRHGLIASPLVIMLLRLAFLESIRRTDILEKSGLARIHVFRNRLPMMHRKNWDGPKASSAMPFAWFVWERGYTGLTTIDRISWE
jgi:hypothetical protein